MQNLINTNIELIESLKENIIDPFVMLDQQGRIKLFNKKASDFFAISKEVENFYELLEPSSIKELGELLYRVFQQDDLLEEELVFNLNSGKSLKVHLTAGQLIEKNEKLILCLFKSIGNNLKKTSLNIITKEIEKIVDSKEILGVIDEVKSNFPFTFIGKNLVRKSINKLKEFFWIKNVNGNYLLVNDKVSASIGLNAIQIEGKNESNFIPPYFVNFQQALNQYVVESANCTIIDGLQFGGLINPEKYETIEIPLFDSQNNIMAVIGIGRKKQEKNESSETESKIKNLLDHVSCAIAYIDKDNRVQFFNAQFGLQFGSKFFDLIGTEYYRILPQKISEKVSRFIKSSSDEESFELKEEEQNFLTKLRKIYSGNLFSGTSISIEEKSPEVENSVETGMQISDRIISGIPFPVFIFNKENLKFLEVNDAALKLYGYLKDEFLNLDLTDLYTEDDMQSLLELTADNIEEGIFNGPYKHRKKDGSNILIEMSELSIIYRGKEAGLNVILDVTKRIELEKNNRIYKAAFDNSAALLFITDDTGFITFINRQVTDILGYSKEDLEKTSFPALFNDSKRAFVSNEIFKSESEKSVAFSGEIKNSKNEFSNFEIAAVPVLNYKNEKDSFVIIAKQKPEIEIKQNTEIEKTGSPNYEPSVLDDTSVLSNMFHEILTPINVILGFVRELTDSIEVLTPDQKEADDIINQNRISLLNTMNTIIDYINVSGSSIKLNITEIKITDIIDNVQKDINNLVSQKNVQLSYGKISSSLIFSSDEQHMRSLIYLLLLMIIHGKKEEKIYLSAYQYDNDNFIIIIKDNYAFTSQKLIEKLNSIIYGKSLNIKNYGISQFTVLLVKKLLHLLKGSVKIVGDNEDKEFGFIFPLDLNKQIDVRTEPEAELNKEEYLDEDWLDQQFPVSDEVINNNNDLIKESYEGEVKPDGPDVLIEEIPDNLNSKKIDLSGLSCFYIEDQLDSQILFSFQMSELKEIKFASSLEEAIPILENNKFDFILLDINLQGDYNGIDALKYIHSIPGFENTPVIAATAYLLPGDKEKFIATGFNDFISKPIFHDNMVESLSKLF